MKTKFLTLMAASVILMGAVGSAIAADKWFVMGEQTIKTADPSANITSQGNRWEKDVKWVKLSAEGADVEIRKVVLHWDNRRDEAISDLGVLKSGGQTAAKEAPGLKRASRRCRSTTRSLMMRRQPTSRSGDLTERRASARRVSLSAVTIELSRL
jgi:hypothetical protein